MTNSRRYQIINSTWYYAIWYSAQKKKLNQSSLINFWRYKLIKGYKFNKNPTQNSEENYNTQIQPFLAWKINTKVKVKGTVIILLSIPSNIDTQHIQRLSEWSELTPCTLLLVSIILHHWDSFLDYITLCGHLTQSIYIMW